MLPPCCHVKGHGRARGPRAAEDWPVCRSERHRVLQMVPTRGSNGLGGVPAPCQGHNPADMALLPTCSPMAPSNPCTAPLGIAGGTLTPAERAAPSFSASTMSLSPYPNLCLKVRMWGVRNPAKTTLRGPCARPSVSAPHARRCLAEVAASSTTHPHDSRVHAAPRALLPPSHHPLPLPQRTPTCRLAVSIPNVNMAL